MVQKGGSGKTTLAVHVAVCAVRHALGVAMIDLDPQRSLYKWNQSRPDNHKIDTIAAEAGQVPGLLKQAQAGGVDLVIIDTAPHSDNKAAIVARMADFILIPLHPLVCMQ